MPNALSKSSGTSLTPEFYMRDFYKFNKNAMKSSTRKTYSGDEKSYEDSRALRRAAKRISSYDFEDENNTETLISAITAYADTYNNVLNSASESSEKDISRYARKLKEFTSEYADKLQDLGITIEKDGTMTVNEDYLKEREIGDLKEVFDPKNGFLNDIMTYSKKIFNKVHTSLYEQLTGNGTMLNVSV